MATSRFPSRLASQAPRLFGDRDSPYLSPSSSCGDIHEHTKKKMQTTVAIREEDPHRFKIRPLKQISVEERSTEGPLLNFDRPFTGPRPDLSTPYKFPSSTLATACHLNSLQENGSSLSQRGLSPPHKQHAPSVTNDPIMNCDTQDKGSCSLSSLATADSLASSCTSLQPTIGDNSQEHIAQTLREYDASQVSILYPHLGAPDLTFELSNELSYSSGPDTPLTSTPSFGSMKHTQSLHLDSPRLELITSSPLEPPALGRTAILQRRARMRAFSVSSLSSSHSKVGLRTCNSKRHAIYGDSDWQVDLPPSNSLLSSLVSSAHESNSAEEPCYVAPPHSSEKKRALYTKSDGFSVRGSYFGHTISPAISSSSYAANQPLILPLRVGSSSGSKCGRAGSVLAHPFMMQELLQEIDDDIQQWQTVSFLTLL